MVLGNGIMLDNAVMLGNGMMLGNAVTLGNAVIFLVMHDAVMLFDVVTFGSHFVMAM